MRILVLANKTPYPPIDGGSIATLNMLTGLRDTGNRVTCLSMNTSKHPFPVNRIPAELTETIRFMGVECDTSIRPVKLILNLLFSRRPYNAQRFRFRAFREKLADLEAEFEEASEQVEANADPAAIALKKHVVRTRKTDLSIDRVALVWKPWSVSKQGIAESLF